MDVLFARQEIYDNANKVVAYELLYRNQNAELSLVDENDESAGDTATSSVIINFFANIHSIFDEYRVFINFTRNHILNNIPELLPKDKIVIEVLENVFVDELLVNRLKELHGKGYTIALDDFVYTPAIQPLLTFANIIKFDLMAMNYKEVEQQLAKIKGFSGELLAEKIENAEDVAWCQKHGFKMYQGYYFTKPNCVEGEKLSENKTMLLNLMAELNNPDADIENVEHIILQIPRLSVRILSLANSVTYYTGVKIDTVLTAMSRLGLQRIRSWVSLMLMASIDDVDAAQLEKILVRAKMCEIIADKDRHTSSVKAYTIGLLSNIDKIFNAPLEELLAKIQLSDEMNQAILFHEGTLGRILKSTLAYESGNFDEAHSDEICSLDMGDAYFDSLNYAKEVLSSI